MKATLINDLPSNREINQRVWKVEPPIDGHEYVITSASTVFRPETYIFPAEHDGKSWAISDFLELDGSQSGTLSHEKVLRDLGYELS